MDIIRISNSDPMIDTLIQMSIDWENEHSCEGYGRNNKSTFIDKTIYVVLDNDEIIGYLYGTFETSSKTNTVQKENDRIFEVEEIFIKKEYRNKGIGSKLFEYVENDIKDKVDIILLSTATKDYKSILHFYINEVGMTFWNARLYKKV